MVTTVMRCYDCGRQPHGTAVAVRHTADGKAGFAGLVSCGRIWLCPVCNAKVMARRAVEIGSALTWATVEGHQVIWGSLTVRHNATSDLRELLEIQKSAWRYVVSSRWWRSFASTLAVEHAHDASCAADCDRKRDTIDTGQPGRVGYIRAAEITIGANGWHPHFHPLVIVRGTPAEAQAIADALVHLWVEGVDNAGGDARAVGGQQLRVLDARGSYDALAGYVTKATYEPAKLAIESVWSQGKVGRGRVKETLSHWTLLAGIGKGLADDAQRWSQLEDATQLHRMISWSRGLRKFAGLGQEVDDETIAAEQLGDRNDDVCYITTDGWLGIRDRPEVATAILDILEGAGWPALRSFLDANDVEYMVLTPATH